MFALSVNCFLLYILSLIVICNSIKFKFTLITCTVTRMVQSEVSFQMAHFPLEHALVVVCGSIWGTYGLFVWWTVIDAYTPRIPGSKCLTNSEVVTGNVDTGIKICERNLYKICNFLGCQPAFLILPLSWHLCSLCQFSTEQQKPRFKDYFVESM